MRRITVTIAFSFCLFLLSQSFPAVVNGAKTEERGQKLFAQYCASCHGMDGKGGGPAATSLKTPIPDLTMIEKRDGKFDQNKVQHIISGEIGFIAHGSKEMPVWGYIFRQKAGGQPAAAVNIYALAAYIKSIQK
jgi:mono/diheme cytochrome c family protein